MDTIIQCVMTTSMAIPNTSGINTFRHDYLRIRRISKANLRGELYEMFLEVEAMTISRFSVAIAGLE